MRTSEFMAEIISSLKQYDKAGILDRVSLYTSLYTGLKQFGQAACVKQDAVISIKNGKGELPGGFHSLLAAYRVSPASYYFKESARPSIINSLFYTERVVKSKEWDSCNECCVTEGENIVSEKVYVNDEELFLYYSNPVRLSLSKGFKKDYLASEYRKSVTPECEDEINIRNKTIDTNFKEGTIYIQFYGIEVDEDGLPVIPDTSKGFLSQYLESFIKARFFEQLITRGDDLNAISMLQYFSQKEQMLYPSAKSDLKFNSLTPDSYSKLKRLNSITARNYSVISRIGR